MTVLFRYLLGHFLAGFAKMTGVALVLILLIDGIGAVQRFSGRPGFNWPDVGLLILHRIPGMLSLMIPAIAFLATILVTTRLSRQSEITVLRGCGRSIVQLLLPFLFGGLLAGAGQMVLQDQIVPGYQRSAQQLKDRLSGKPDHSGRSGLHWFREGRESIHVAWNGRNETVMTDLTLLRLDENHRPLSLLAARRGQRRDRGLELEEVDRFTYGETTHLEHLARHFEPLAIDPKRLGRNAADPEFLSLAELTGEARHLHRSGQDPTPFRLARLARYAAPVTTLVAIWLAFPFALGLTRQGNAARSAVTGLLLGFALFVVTDLATALGAGNRLPPLLAAWTPVMLFFGIGLFQIVRREEPG